MEKKTFYSFLLLGKHYSGTCFCQDNTNKTHYFFLLNASASRFRKAVKHVLKSAFRGPDPSLLSCCRAVPAVLGARVCRWGQMDSLRGARCCRSPSRGWAGWAFSWHRSSCVESSQARCLGEALPAAGSAVGKGRKADLAKPETFLICWLDLISVVFSKPKDPTTVCFPIPGVMTTEPPCITNS